MNDATHARALPLDGLRLYKPDAGHLDEMVTADGELRDHWRPLFDSLNAMSPAQHGEARKSADAMLRDNGFSYLYTEEPHNRRPWRLDILPLILPSNDWSEIERGLTQRAELLNRIATDLNGPLDLLQSGILPPAVVFSDPDCPLPRQNSANGRFLQFLCFDLERSRDGGWQVLEERVELAAGLGYALENRIITSRVLAQQFLSQKIHLLASFFRAADDYLLTLANGNLVVVLSEGPHNADYIEHAFLGRYLGYPVVRDDDLTVRESRLYLKTLRGLQRVDLVIRRLASKYCDPLEVYQESSSGIAGIMHAASEGNVMLANAIGCQVVENRCLQAYLPHICKRMLNQDLYLPSTPSWWCGEAAGLHHVCANLDSLDLFPAFGLDQHPAVNGRPSLEEIRAYPWRFAARQAGTTAAAPHWSDDGELSPLPWKLRAFVAATAQGYKVMPGAIALLREPGQAAATICKDVWFLSEHQVSGETLLPKPVRAATLRRSNANLTSRNAEDCFWFGRYLERADGCARLYRALFAQLAGEESLFIDHTMAALLTDLLVAQNRLSAMRADRFHATGGGFRNIVFDPDATEGLAKLLDNLAQIADRVRGELSVDTWRILEKLTRISRIPRIAYFSGEVIDLLHELITCLAALSGLVYDNATRDYSWLLLDSGRRIERAEFTIAIIRTICSGRSVNDEATCNLLLELNDSAITYRARYRMPPQLPAALDLTLADESNPRSLYYQVKQLQTNLAALPDDRESNKLDRRQQLLVAMHAELTLLNIDQLCDTQGGGWTPVRPALDALLQQLETGLDQLAEKIANTYFSHSVGYRITGAASHRKLADDA